jgi:flagellar biosynthetic protein FlhB
MREADHDRTEQATPFKLEESRRHGDVARSVDVNSFVFVATLLLLLVSGGATAWTRACEACRILFAGAGSSDSAWLLGQFGQQLLNIALPFGLIGMAVAIAANVLQTGPVFSFKQFTPRFERINPVTGLRRVFSRRLLIEMLKSIFKLLMLGAVAYAFFRGLAPELTESIGQSPSGLLAFLARNGTALLLRLSMALLLIAVIDWSLVRWQYRRRMMMSRRELKEEIRRREGDPHIRARMRELQKANLKQSRALGRIPDSDVLITNPDHVGVALRYVRGEMSAPYVIAKGGGQWVERMRGVARAHGVPILQRRALARRLYRDASVDRPIPADVYVEVAQLYAELGAEQRARSARYEVAS